MCFSPEADLVAGIAATVVGIDAIRHTSRRELVPMAALPVVFGVHQLIETMVWWNLRGNVPDCVGEPAMWAYLLIALCLVPALVPFAFGSAGLVKSRLLARALLGSGVVSGAVLFGAVLDGPTYASIDGHHIAYHVGTPWVVLTLGLYIVAACAPGLVSHERSLRLFGLTNLLVVGALIWLAQTAVVSLWCVWAAISSLLINRYVRAREVREPVQIRDVLPQA